MDGPRWAAFVPITRTCICVTGSPSTTSKTRPNIWRPTAWSIPSTRTASQTTFAMALPWSHIVGAEGLLASMQPGEVYSLTAHGEIAMCDSLEFDEMVKMADADTLSTAAQTSISAKKQPS